MNNEHKKALEAIMTEMRGMFPSHFRLTLVARNVSTRAPDEDILITEDELERVIGTLDRIRVKNNNDFLLRNVKSH